MTIGAYVLLGIYSALVMVFAIQYCSLPKDSRDPENIIKLAIIFLLAPAMFFVGCCVFLVESIGDRKKEGTYKKR